MARPLRVELAGALWHVTCRGNERREIFRDDADRYAFLGILAEAVEKFVWTLHAYVLMGNHYHLLLETPECNLTRGMHRINGIYSQRFNRRHGRVGHLLQGRFKAILVEKERHLLELVRYVVLNPVRAGLAIDAAGWRWSNYRATAGLGEAPPWLDTTWTVSQFGRGKGAQRAYREFVEAGRRRLDRPWSEVAGQLFLGGEDFRRRMRQLLAASQVDTEIPRPQRAAIRPTLADVVRAAARVLEVDSAEIRKPRRTPLRLAVAYIARNDAWARLTDLGQALAVTTTSASEIASSASRLRRQEPEFRALLRRIRSELRRIQT